MFLGIYSLTLGYPVCWHITVCCILWWLNFCYIRCNFFLISYFLYIWALFWFISLAKVHQFCLSFQKLQLLVYLFYFFFFLVSILFPLWSLLFSSFYWLCALFFFVALDGKLGYLFDFSCFLKEASITINFPVRIIFAVSYRFYKVVFLHFSFIPSYFLNFFFLYWPNGFWVVCFQSPLVCIFTSFIHAIDF